MNQLFHFQDLNILMDVESGAIHTLDDAAAKVEEAIEKGMDPYQAGLSTSETEEILADFQELASVGSYNSPVQKAPEIKGGAAIKSMCLHVAHDCNLRCRYCFAGTGGFGGSRMIMPLETAKAALDYLMAASGSRRHIEVDLFGGEPLINVPGCREVVAYGRKLEKKWGKEIHFTITTNCLALNDEIIDWINREMHNVVISLDGRKEIHDALRPTVAGNGSYDRIVEKAQKLVSLRGDKEYYIRGTFTRKNLDFLEDVKALLNLGFRQISVEPVVLPAESPYSIREEHLPRIMEEYDRLADFYIESRKKPETWFNFFHFMFDPKGGPCLRKRINGCGAGFEYTAVTPDGDLYPCHQFVGMTDWKIGSLTEGITREDLVSRFAKCNVCTKEKCQGCWAKYGCSGGCLANACLYGGGLDQPHSISCELMKKRYACAIGIYLKEHGEA